MIGREFCVLSFAYTTVWPQARGIKIPIIDVCPFSWHSFYLTLPWVVCFDSTRVGGVFYFLSFGLETTNVTFRPQQFKLIKNDWIIQSISGHSLIKSKIIYSLESVPTIDLFILRPHIWRGGLVSCSIFLALALRSLHSYHNHKVMEKWLHVTVDKILRARRASCRNGRWTCSRKCKG